MTRFLTTITFILTVLMVGNMTRAQQTAPEASSVPAEKQFRGFVVPSRQVILSAPLDAVLAEVNVEEGDRVTKDLVLVRMDDKVQAVLVEAAAIQANMEPQVRNAKISLEYAQLEYELMEKVAQSGAADPLELRRKELLRNQAEAAYDKAIQDQELAKANLHVEKEKLARYKLIAPFDGTIHRVLVDPGSTLTRGDQVLSLVALQTLEAHINLDVDIYGQLEIGKQYRLMGEAPAEGPLVGRLKTIDPVIETRSNTFRCVFEIDNQQNLPAGFWVYLPWPQQTAGADANAAATNHAAVTDSN